MKKRSRKAFCKVCITTGLGVLMATSVVPVVSLPVYAATQVYQPDYTYSPSGKGGVHISDETASVLEDSDNNGNVIGKKSGTDFYVSEWDADPNDPRTECKVWIRVLDEDGNAVRVTLALSRKDNGLVQYPWMGKDTLTDADGDLLFYVPEGDYTILLQVPDGYQAFQSGTYTMKKGENYYEIRLKKKTNNNNGGSNSGGNHGGHGNGGSNSNKGNSSDSDHGPGVKPTSPAETTPNTPEESKSNPTVPETSGENQRPGENPSKENPSTPGKNTKDEYVVPGKDDKHGTPDDVTIRPGRDENGKNNSSQDPDGKVDLPDGGDVIYPSQPDQGDISVKVPEGTTVNPDGSLNLPEKNQQTEIILPGKDKTLGTEDDVIVRPGLDENGKNNTIIGPDGKISLPDGGRVIHPSIPDQGKIGVDVPKGSVILPDGTMNVPDGLTKRYTLPGRDATLDTTDDVLVVPQLGANGKDRSILRDDGSILLTDGGTVTYADGTNMDVPAGTIILPDGTIIYPDDGNISEEPSKPTDGTVTGIGFRDCWFHWLEILALFIVIAISMKRLFEIKEANKELDKMDEEQNPDQMGRRED